MDIKQMNETAAEIKELLGLRTYPIAVKFCRSVDEVPEDALFPRRDLGTPATFCQMLALVRTEGKAVAMGKQDHRCWNPIVAFGLVEAEAGSPAGDIIIKRALGIADEEKAEAWWARFPKLPLDEFPYVVVAPAEKATFEPDVILVYSNTRQVMWEIGGVRRMTGEYITSQFDAIDSCVHSTLRPLKTGEYWITFPDPGDRSLANARENEVILSFPAERLDEFAQGIRETQRMYDHPEATDDQPLKIGTRIPPFAHELFAIWGIEDCD